MRRASDRDVDATHTTGREDQAATCVITTMDTSEISRSIGGEVNFKQRANEYATITVPMAVASVANHAHIVLMDCAFIYVSTMCARRRFRLDVGHL